MKKKRRSVSTKKTQSDIKPFIKKKKKKKKNKHIGSSFDTAVRGWCKEDPTLRKKIDAHKKKAEKKIEVKNRWRISRLTSGWYAVTTYQYKDAPIHAKGMGLAIGVACAMNDLDKQIRGYHA